MRAARDGDCKAVRILLAANAHADSQNMVQLQNYLPVAKSYA
jgi:hypothetical protein